MKGRPFIYIARILAIAALALMAGCDMVGVSHVTPKEYATQRRSDVLNTRALSDSTLQTLNVVALNRDECAANFTRCTNTILLSDGLDDERRLSALSELWLSFAIQRDHANSIELNDPALDAYLQSARYAYAYLFYTPRDPGERAFETRQSQVLDFYNYATQQAVANLFKRLPELGIDWNSRSIAGWNLLRPTTDVYLGSGDYVPQELIPAEGLRFSGLRNVYRRDGFGSEFVAIGVPAPEAEQAWRESRYVPLTAVLEFPGDTLNAVLNTHDVRLFAKNPYLDSSITLDGQNIPLAANFTAPYGVWLARSGFAKQSLRSMLGRGGITKPEVLLMQPYNPDRLTVIMLHGLASSPEAWINVVNEVMGDEQLRRTYQVWEVYYPTNVPVAVNRLQISQAIEDTIHHFDPTGRAAASHHIVLIGHSMGGVIARLLVSSSDDKLWRVVPERNDLTPAQKQKVRSVLAPYLQFEPMPQVTRAIFLAAPHRGTPVAQWKLARWIGNLIILPVTLLEQGKNLTDATQGKPGTSDIPARVPNSIDNLSNTDPFIEASSTLPISPNVHYHTIVGLYKSKGPLNDSDDGVVPYTSAHLEGADSELAVPSWHNVQDTPQAIIELRRILRLHASLLHCLQPPGDQRVACHESLGTSP